MDKLRIYGGQPLEGTVHIGGAKNAALPLMAASLLTSEPLILSSMPHLTDISSMANLLTENGVKFTLLGEDEANHGHMGRVIQLHAERITSIVAPYELVRRMRASIVVLGPLLARMGEAQVSLPGGCAIGPRPVDIHIKGLEAMGADIRIEGGYIHAKAPRGGLKGADITMPKVTVTGTENLLMAATLARGTTHLRNAAKEPEVTDLARCLKSMGAVISGEGTDTIVVEGQEALSGTSHKIIPDRIEAGTYMIAAAMTQGDLLIENVNLDDIPVFTKAFLASGAEVIPVRQDAVRVQGDLAKLKSVDISTAPYPGFPTDLQAQFMALMSLSKGKSVIHETLFENRMMHVPELCRMGADIAVQGTHATVGCVSALNGAEVMATDLRASVSLVLAALAAKGETIINRIYHLDRGYERIEDKLRACGANLERITSDDTKPMASNKNYVA